MQNSSNISIPNVLEYYDKNNETYDAFLKKIQYYKIVRGTNDLEYSYFYLYDKDKKEILKSRYENIGVYNNKSHTWAWAWSVPRFTKNTTTIVRKIVNYGMELPFDALFLKTELITSRFRITSSIQLDMHIALASYLSKKPLVFRFNVYTQEMKSGDLDMIADLLISEEEKENYVTYFVFLLDENILV